jgi:putative two-component system response regulator
MAGLNDLTVLIVDDDSQIRKLLVRIFTRNGCLCLEAEDGREALKHLDREPVELAILDVNMPGMNGLDCLRVMKQRGYDTAVLMLTGNADREVAISALEAGAYGYLVKPYAVNRREIIIHSISALERRRLTLAEQHRAELLEALVLERTRDLRKREEEILLRLVTAVQHRSDETGDHIRRVGVLAAALAKELNWAPERVAEMRLAAPMHDIGKIGIRDTILLKPGKISADEFEEMKRHTLIGARILASEEIPLLRMASEIALAHHERWDGLGYPHGLSGEAIPEAARVVSIVDVFDALCSDRVYRPAFPKETVMEMLTEGRGTQFDPRLLDLFVATIPQAFELRAKVSSNFPPIAIGDVKQD